MHVCGGCFERQSFEPLRSGLCTRGAVGAQALPSAAPHIVPEELCAAPPARGSDARPHPGGSQGLEEDPGQRPAPTSRALRCRWGWVLIPGRGPASSDATGGLAVVAPGAWAADLTVDTEAPPLLGGRTTARASGGDGRGAGWWVSTLDAACMRQPGGVRDTRSLAKVRGEAPWTRPWALGARP